MHNDVTLSSVRRALDAHIQPFMRLMHNHPSIIEGRAYAQKHGQFTMNVPDVGKNTYIIFTPTNEKWHFTANTLSDDYVVVVEGDAAGKGWYWELYHDRYGTGDRLVCLSTDAHPFIRGMTPPQFHTVASCVETNMKDFARLYTNPPEQVPDAAPQLSQREKKILAIIAAVVTVIIGCSGLFLAFLHLGE